MFEQPEVTSTEQLGRRNQKWAFLLVRLVVLALMAVFTPRFRWLLLVVPIGLLLLFGPIVIGQRLGRRS